MNNTSKINQIYRVDLSLNPDIINNINYEKKEYTNDWLKH